MSAAAKRRAAALATLALGFVACLPTQASASFPGGNGLIAFTSNRDGDREIYTMTPSGSTPVKLTTNSVEDDDPEWNHDGTKIVFTSQRDGDREIYVMNADGSGQERLTNNAADDRDPTWSPDGTKIAFRSNRRDDNNDIWVMNANGGGAVNLTADSDASDFNPDWSPDGTKIAYQRFLSGSGVGFGNEVFVMNAADGSAKTNLTNNTNSTNDGEPSWSPDGTEIAYRNNGFGGTEHDIYTMDADGTDSIRRTSAPGPEEKPAWSPDGQLIVFQRVSGSNQPELYTMEIPAAGFGQNITNRTNDAGEDIKASWQPDTTPPDTTITAGPGEDETVTDPTPSFGFSSSEEHSTFECRVDEGDWQACDPGDPTAELADGPHTFAVRAIDVAGNVDQSPAQRAFTVDTTPPATTFTSTPADSTNEASPSFGFEADDPEATFECRLDSSSAGDWEPCSSPHALGPLADGPHTFEVRATDAVGNVEGTPATRTFTVDTAAPETTIGSGPSGPTPNPSPEFAFSSDDPEATFECRLDSSSAGDWEPCITPHPLGPLADGPHTFEVRATDAVGNIGPVAARSFTVDTTPPRTTIHSHPGALTNDPTPAFEFSSEAGATFECRLGPTDGATWFECESPVVLGPLSDGRHRFDVRATDRAGNRESSERRHEFTVDTLAPRLTITAGPEAVSSETRPRFEFVSDDPTASFSCGLDPTGPAAFAECTSPYTSPRLDEGMHVFELRASDPAGNIASLIREFRVELENPPGPPVVGELQLGRPRLRRRSGTATLPVTVPAAGSVLLDGKRLRPRRRTLSGPGAIKLELRARRGPAKRLRKRGSLRVRARVTFQPTAGAASARTLALRLVRRR